MSEEKKPRSLFMKIMIAIVPLLIVGLILMIVYRRHNREKQGEVHSISLPKSEIEKAPTSKAEAYKDENEKKRAKQQLAEESIVSNTVFYDFENDKKTAPKQEQVTPPPAPPSPSPQAVAAPQVENSKRAVTVKAHKSSYSRSNQPKSTPESDAGLTPLEKLQRKQRTAGIKTSQPIKQVEVQAPQEPVLQTKVNTNPNGRSRNIGGSSQSHSANLISAVIHNDQVISNGTKVKLRLTEDIVVDGVSVPRNSFVSGIATFSKTRMSIALNSVIVGNNIIPFNRVVYDKDGMEGIYLPDNFKSEAASDATSDVTSGAMSAIGGPIGAAGIAMSVGKNLVRKTIQRQTVTLKSNYKIFIK